MPDRVLFLKQTAIVKKIIAHKLIACVSAGLLGISAVGLAAYFATSGSEPIVPIKIPGVTKEKSILQTDSDNNGQKKDESSNQAQSSNSNNSNQSTNNNKSANNKTEGSNDGASSEDTSSMDGESSGDSGDGGGSTNSPPTAPTNATATVLFHNLVTIRVNRATDTNGIARHELLRNGTVVASSTSANDPLTVSDNSPVVGQTYTYNVRAVDSLGAVGPNSNSVVVTIPPEDTTPPSLPTNFRIVSNTPGEVVFAWDPSTDNQTAQGDIWYILTSPLDESYYYTWTRVNPHSTGWFDQPGTTHDVYIQARDLAGNESAKVGPVTFTAQ